MKKISLSQGKFTLVDNKDFDELNQHRWSAHKRRHTWYAVRTVADPLKKDRQRTIFMHREIMDTPDGLETDHIDGDGLDNRRSNLRVCTNAENGRNHRRYRNNLSGITGVHWYRQCKCWKACIAVDSKLIFLGLFTNKKDATKARRDAEIKYYGDFRAKRPKVC